MFEDHTENKGVYHTQTFKKNWYLQRVSDERISLALQLLTGGSLRLREQCNLTADPNVDMRLRTQQVIQCAYDIAKAAKQLVILFE